MPTHPLFPLAIKHSKAKIILTPCPGSQEVDLTTSLAEMKAIGVEAVLTLMTPLELEKNALSNIGTSVKAKGMSWFHLPIADDEAPDAVFLKTWETAGPAIHRLIEQGKTIAVHCKGGSGRTGIVAAQILLERGESIKPVIGRIKKLRPNAFTSACQRDYLENLPI